MIHDVVLHIFEEPIFIVHLHSKVLVHIPLFYQSLFLLRNSSKVVLRNDLDALMQYFDINFVNSS